ncbi:peptidoglycan-recognition protein SC2-like isoform X2 [Pecten maximus]|uniref:peptidoglycan-recognition protein SC2-like isoform X2 n=1 Tax=Pecten maximus TaxID=6579 RepID=UPI001459186E|nr:peptidoglycan-recognition protein SC2-like isoform X2 [Pecten maximus]
MSLLTLIVLVAFSHISVGFKIRASCLNLRGTCQHDSTSCSGNYVSNLCSGSSSIRCCVPSSDGTSQTICSNIQVVSRATWGARKPKKVTTITNAVPWYFVHHTETPTCYNETECAKLLKSIQNYHMNERGYNDIGYSFLIGQDGRVYEGRGWGVVGAHTRHYNSRSYGVSFIGNFMKMLPIKNALNAAKGLAQCGLNKGFMKPTYSLFGHRDVGDTDCPGNSLYAEIRTWDRYNYTHHSPFRH